MRNLPAFHWFLFFSIRSPLSQKHCWIISEHSTSYLLKQDKATKRFYFPIFFLGGPVVHFRLWNLVVGCLLFFLVWLWVNGSFMDGSSVKSSNSKCSLKMARDRGWSCSWLLYSRSLFSALRTMVFSCLKVSITVFTRISATLDEAPPLSKRRPWISAAPATFSPLIFSLSLSWNSRVLSPREFLL